MKIALGKKLYKIFTKTIYNDFVTIYEKLKEIYVLLPKNNGHVELYTSDYLFPFTNIISLNPRHIILT